MNDKDKIGYKVVYNNDGVLRSCLIKHPLNIVEYKIGKRTYHSIGSGPIAVFNKIGDALAFRFIQFNSYKAQRMNPYGESEIWECEYRKHRYQKLWMVDFTNRKDIFMNRKYGRIKHKSFPSGTEFAKWVKLTTKID